MPLLDDLRAALGADHVLTGEDVARYATDWMRHYRGAPLAVVRPASTAEVSTVLRAAAAAGVPVVPISGNTGLVGGTMTRGGLMLSLERLNRIREVRPGSRLVIAEAGVVVQKIHEAVAEHGLYFPLWFGGRGSAMLGGVLSTNAGGSNVLRYGSTRALCLGLEVVLADGRILDLMSELYKDNSGYDLKQLFIGAEGMLGIITAAVMRLVPQPLAHATAMVAAHRLADTLPLLNRMQEATGGRVEAFEFMPDNYMRRLAEVRPDLGQAFEPIPEASILIEAATTVPAEAAPLPDGTVPLVGALEGVLGDMLEEGLIADAQIARSEAQRMQMWARREAAAEICLGFEPVVEADVSLPLERVEDFLTQAPARLAANDLGFDQVAVAHLGDGNIHYSVRLGRNDPALAEAQMEIVEEVVQELRGSFSAEHGIGLMKLPAMRRHKNPVALDLMRILKAALDPEGLMNPGKVIPED